MTAVNPTSELSTTTLRFTGADLTDPTQRIDYADLVANFETVVPIGNTHTFTLRGTNTTGGTNEPVLVRNLVDPVADQDAATKVYVDSMASGIVWHDAVVTATDAPLTTPVAAQVVVGATIGGVVLAADDRVLVKNQAEPDPTGSADNGLWVVQATGNAVRAADLPVGAVATGVAVFVEGGTSADQGYVQTRVGAVVGTNFLDFTQFFGPGQVTAGAGLSKTDTTISVALTATPASGLGFTGSGDAATLNIAALGVTNAMLAGAIENAKLTNSSLTVPVGDGLSGGGLVALGATATTIAVDATVVRTTGAQTIGGVKTLSSELIFTGTTDNTSSITLPNLTAAPTTTTTKLYSTSEGLFWQDFNLSQGAVTPGTQDRLTYYDTATSVASSGFVVSGAQDQLLGTIIGATGSLQAAPSIGGAGTSITPGGISNTAGALSVASSTGNVDIATTFTNGNVTLQSQGTGTVQVLDAAGTASVFSVDQNGLVTLGGPSGYLAIPGGIGGSIAGNVISASNGNVYWNQIKLNQGADVEAGTALHLAYYNTLGAGTPIQEVPNFTIQTTGLSIAGGQGIDIASTAPLRLGASNNFIIQRTVSTGANAEITTSAGDLVLQNIGATGNIVANIPGIAETNTFVIRNGATPTPADLFTVKANGYVTFSPITLPSPPPTNTLYQSGNNLYWGGTVLNAEGTVNPGVANQMAYYVDANTVGGTANLTVDGSDINITGNINLNVNNGTLNIGNGQALAITHTGTVSSITNTAPGSNLLIHNMSTIADGDIDIQLGSTDGTTNFNVQNGATTPVNLLTVHSNGGIEIPDSAVAAAANQLRATGGNLFWNTTQLNQPVQLAEGAPNTLAFYNTATSIDDATGLTVSGTGFDTLNAASVTTTGLVDVGGALNATGTVTFGTALRMDYSGGTNIVNIAAGQQLRILNQAGAGIQLSLGTGPLTVINGANDTLYSVTNAGVATFNYNTQAPIFTINTNLGSDPARGGIQFANDFQPVPTTNTLYRFGSNMYWNGTKLATGGDLGVAQANQITRYVNGTDVGGGDATLSAIGNMNILTLGLGPFDGGLERLGISNVGGNMRFTASLPMLFESRNNNVLARPGPTNSFIVQQYDAATRFTVDMNAGDTVAYGYLQSGSTTGNIRLTPGATPTIGQSANYNLLTLAANQLTVDGNLLLGSSTDGITLFSTLHTISNSGDAFVIQNATVPTGDANASTGDITIILPQTNPADPDAIPTFRINRGAGGGAATLISVDSAGLVNTTNTATATNPSEGTYTGSVVMAGGLAIEDNLIVANDMTASSYVTSSDERLKKDIVDLTDSDADILNQLLPKKYKWIDEAKGTKEQCGFIAQDLESTLPNAVDDSGAFKSVNYQYIIPLLVKKIQQLEARLAAVESA